MLSKEKKKEEKKRKKEKKKKEKKKKKERSSLQRDDGLGPKPYDKAMRNRGGTPDPKEQPINPGAPRLDMGWLRKGLGSQQSQRETRQLG